MHDDTHDLGVPFPFAATEYERRLSELRGRLAAQGVDGLVSVAQESAYYLFGYDQIGYWVFQAIWIPTDPTQPVRGLCRAADELLMRRSYGIDEVVVWWDDDSGSSPVAPLMSWLEESGARRVGLETRSHALVAEYAFEIDAECARRGMELVPLPAVVTQMREVKTDDELVLMRRAGTSLARAYAAVEPLIRPGMADTQLSAEVLATLVRDGCDLPAVAPCIASGVRTLSQTHLSAKNQPIPPGDVVTVELAAAVERYHAVAFRTYFTEGAEPSYRRQYDGLVRALGDGASVIRAGASSTDVAARIHESLDRIGHHRRGRHVGYGIGIGFPPSWLDGLRLKSTQSFELTSGMTIFLLLASITDDGKRYVGVGDPVVVTDDGFEYLMPGAGDIAAGAQG